MTEEANFRIWQESRPVQLLFEGTSAVDKYVLNNSIMGIAEAIWPILVVAGITAVGAGYIKGRNQKAVSKGYCQLKGISI